MRKNKRLLLPVLGMLSAGIFMSCGNDESESDTTSVLSIGGAEVMTRSGKDAFASGDEIGVFVLDKDGNMYNDCDCSRNNKATLQTDWTLEKNVYLGSHPGTVHAYYPYRAEVDAPADITVTSSERVDVLFSKEVTVNADNPVVTLQMQHALSVVKFVIKKDGYSGAGHLSGIVLQGIGVEGTLDICTGEIAVGKTGNEGYKGEFTLGDSPLAIGIMALPQTVTSTTVLLMIDGERYGYKLPSGEWEQGKEVTYTLGIDSAEKKLFQIGSSTIDNWGDGGSYEGDLTPGIDIGTEI